MSLSVMDGELGEDWRAKCAAYISPKMYNESSVKRSSVCIPKPKHRELA